MTDIDSKGIYFFKFSLNYYQIYIKKEEVNVKKDHSFATSDSNGF